jgi:hypothetical protein
MRVGVEHDPEGVSCSRAALRELSRNVKPAVESSARATWVSASPLKPVSVMTR